VATAVESRGSGGQSRRNSEDVGVHDFVIGGGIEISDRRNGLVKECFFFGDCKDGYRVSDSK
jgi:hypothetical protein